jgi:uncharacterized membrane protein
MDLVYVMGNPILDFFSSEYALLFGRLILGINVALLAYAFFARGSRGDSLNKIDSKMMAFVIVLSILAVTFPLSPYVSFGLFGLIWGWFQLVVLIFFVFFCKFFVAMGLMLPRVKGWRDQRVSRMELAGTALFGIGVITIDFLADIVKYLSNILGELSAIAFYVAWIIGFLLSLKGAYKYFFGFKIDLGDERVELGFIPAMQQISGESLAIKVSAFTSVISIVIVMPQIIPLGSILTKPGTVIGVLWMIWVFRKH